jgi:diadenosine tetraphosphatase ApaH/serine/threonine PP2A family protein phosphatase
MVFVRDDGVRRQNSEHIRIEPGKKYFINAGSVGQPRDGNWRAGYCIYDIENNLVELLRVKYDLATAQKKNHEGWSAATACRAAWHGTLKDKRNRR